ncbi:NADP-dependent oxidoreductase [Corynebacterium heidelbergense]|uniref:NADP-dependent oxidoreductase n=1 Tax=Corynebacterium heidelbergense TaxID=2055947 RepID=A0A364V5A3_9CORY|nr:NADP-dependent oxidoreductase [Corynebacterium heidelbergense]RAV31812.1 NADP-dependent oxidoreductase [Corynebacterium heidelbergense]
MRNTHDSQSGSPESPIESAAGARGDGVDNIKDANSPSAGTTTTRIVLASRPHGEPTQDNFRTETANLQDPGEDEALLETLFLSLDPYMRGRMSDAESYADPVEIGDVVVGATVSRVLASGSPEFAEGDLVLGYGGWQTHSLEKTAHLRKLDKQAEVSPSTSLGVLGMPGFTAWAGMNNIGHPKEGETVVVAAATGPVGSMVGQVAKLAGARAVGIAGGPKKVEYLKELGFDAAIDHKAEDFEEQLAAATPDGIDVYYENVGGKVWEAVLPRLNTYARVPVCGLVSGYNSTELPEGPDRSGQLMGTILRKSLTIRGFIQTEYADQMGDFLEEMTPRVADGSVKFREDVVDGLDSAVDAFIGMLNGKNFGKLVVKVAD